MAALNFPTSPTVNQVYTANNRTWTWDGTSWVSSTALTGIPPVIVSTALASYTATATSGSVVIFCDTTANTVTVNLPTAVGNTAVYYIKKIAAANTLVIDAATTETIDDGLTATISVQNDSLALISNNINWKII